MRMIFGVILCCVISVQIDARVVHPVHIMVQDHRADSKSVRDQNDVYGAETIQLNGRSPRASSWPEPNSATEKMFLLPKILEVGDQINATMLISRNKNWLTVSLVTGQEGPKGIQPDYNNTACQLSMLFDSNEGSGTIVLKTIWDGNTEEHNIFATVTDLIPDLYTHTVSEVIVRMEMVENSRGNNEVHVYMGESDSYLEKVILKHEFNDIRLLTFDGAVEKVKRLDFTYA